MKSFSRTLVRNYATADIKFQLSDAVKKALKPEIVQVIERKKDELLNRKLNLSGPQQVAKLNFCPRDLLGQLSNDNVFNTLAEELPDTWEYYWSTILDCGTDREKWLQALEEIKDIPIIQDKCFRYMCSVKMIPAPEHYEAYAWGLADSGDFAGVHRLIIDLAKRNLLYAGEDKGQLNIPLFRAYIKGCPDKGMAKIVYGILEKKDLLSKVPKEDLEAYKELQEKDQGFIYEGVVDHGVAPIPGAEEYYDAWLDSYLMETTPDKLAKYDHPPIEKLYNVTEGPDAFKTLL